MTLKDQKDVIENQEAIVFDYTSIAPIARPMAGKKLIKKTYKLIKRGVKRKCLRRGVKEVVKAVRKGQTGIVILAGNISPIDVISHIPILCEESNIPYFYVPSKSDLGGAAQTSRPTSVMMITNKTLKDIKESDKSGDETDKADKTVDFIDLYQQVYKEASTLKWSD